MQEDIDRSGRVLCITFGAPPSSVTSTTMKLEAAWDESHLQRSLFWNFLLGTPVEADDMHQSMFDKHVLFDVMPAVLGTLPSGLSASKKWFAAIEDVLEAIESRYDARDMLDQALYAVAAAGMLPAEVSLCVPAGLTGFPSLLSMPQASQEQLD